MKKGNVTKECPKLIGHITVKEAIFTLKKSVIPSIFIHSVSLHNIIIELANEGIVKRGFDSKM